MNPVRILHLEDLPTDAELIDRILQKSSLEFEKLLVSNATEFRKGLQEFHPDIILSDHSLPGFDSTGALKIIRELDIKIPFILLTATMTEEFAVEIMKQGAADYILKDRLQRLPAAITNALEKFRAEQLRDKQIREISDYKFALDTTSIVAVTTEKGIITYANDNFCQISGYSRDELLGKDHRITRSGHHPREYIEKLWQTISEGKIWKGEFKNKSKDGRFYWVDTTIIPIKREVNRPMRYLSIMTDITEVKNARQQLQLAQDRLMFHIENSPLGYIEYDKNGFVKSFSRQAENIFGYSEVEVLNLRMRWAKFVYKEDFDTANKFFTDLLSGRSDRNTVQYRTYKKDGGVIWCEWYNSVLRNNHGETLTILSLVHNITDRIKNEDDLKLSENRLKEAQALSHISNWDVDLKSNQHTWSDEFFHILGLEVNELPACRGTFEKFVHPDDLATISKIMDMQLKDFSASNMHFRFIRNDGMLRYGYSEWRYELDEQGHPLRIFGIMKDITERIVAEKEREQMIGEIVQRNKDLEQFSYIISHNLRAPVANILGYSTAIQHNQISKEDKDELLQGLATSVRKLDDVIKDLNSILQVKREINERKEKIDLNKLVKDIKESIRNQIEEARITITCEFGASSEFFSIKSYLYSIFFNLISNSIKYRRMNVPLIIQINGDLKENQLILNFSDNGSGIDLSRKGDHVFGLYKRFHFEVEGKGLGLFMTKTQVETLGGKITISSEVNQGTTFTIILPL